MKKEKVQSLIAEHFTKIVQKDRKIMKTWGQIFILDS